MMVKQQTFGEFIAQKRKEKRISLRKMANQLSCSAVYLSDVEKGKRNPPDRNRLQILISVLELSQEEKRLFFDLVGTTRGIVAPDIADYLIAKPYMNKILRQAIELHATQEDWQMFLSGLEQKHVDK